MDDLTITNRSDNPADDRLVARFRAGEAQAFDDLAALHLDRLYAIAFDVLKQREDAEEVTQEALFRLYRELAGRRPPQYLRAWLYRVCLNLAIDKRRAQKRRPKTVELSPAAEAATGGDPAKMAEEGQLRQAVMEALEALPEQQRRAFTLCHFAGLNSKETAKILNCTPTTVRVHLSKATQRLREVLTKELMEDEDV